MTQIKFSTSTRTYIITLISRAFSHVLAQHEHTLTLLYPYASPRAYITIPAFFFSRFTALSTLTKLFFDAAIAFFFRSGAPPKGKKKTSAAKPRPTAIGNPKKRPPAKKKRTSYDQIKAQLAVINQIKVRRTNIVLCTGA